MTKQTVWIKTPLELHKNKELTASEKQCYVYMLWRYIFFRNQGKPYRESQESIAEFCGMSKRSVVTAVAQLQDKGYLDIVERIRGAGGTVNNVYVVADKYGVYTKAASTDAFDDPNW